MGRSTQDPDQQQNVTACVGSLIPRSERTEYFALAERNNREKVFKTVLSEVPAIEQAALVQYVMQGLQAIRGDARPLNEISTFERSVSRASAMRGWAATIIHATDNGATFNIEYVAKNVHIGWARAIVTEWDPEYGLEPIGHIQMTEEGLMDSFNFENAKGYRMYRERALLAQQRYLLPGEAVSEFGFVHPIPERQKHLYRAAAEILFHAYSTKNPGFSYMRNVMRSDDFVAVELKQLGVIQPPPKRGLKQLSKVQKSLLYGSKLGSISGKTSNLNLPTFAIPEPAKEPARETITVELTLPLGLKYNIDGTNVVVTGINEGGAAGASGKVHQGMNILSINGKPVEGLNKKEITSIIKSSKGQGKVKVKQANFAEIFKQMDKKKAGIDHLPGSWESLEHTCRYRDVIPNQHSRVKLAQIGDDVLTTFYNANHMRSHNNMPNWYIAAQGAKPETLADWWRMVWEQQTEAIVMTTGIVEGGRGKCAQYWPLEPTDPPMQCGDFMVTTISTKRVGEYLFSNIELKTTPSNGELQVRNIGHFWYDTWPDHGAPKSTKGVTDMLKDVEVFSAGGPDHPWIVHCSAGLGRTGTFIGIHMGMQQLNEAGNTTPQTLIKEMREDRGGSVQAAIQASFMQGALVTYANAIDRRCFLELQTKAAPATEPEVVAKPPTPPPKEDEFAGFDEVDDALMSFAGAKAQVPPVWFHGELDKVTASTVLAKEEDGAFLVRQRINKPELALALTHNGAVTHHSITRSDRNMLMVNGSISVGNVTKLTDFIDRLRLARNTWPQPLSAFIARPGCSMIEIKQELAHAADIQSRADEFLAKEAVDQQEEEERIAFELQQLEERRARQQEEDELQRLKAEEEEELQRVKAAEEDELQRVKAADAARGLEEKAAADAAARAEAHKPHKAKKDDVGKRCTVTGYDSPGTIRFFGPHQADGKKKVGVELDSPDGKNNGTIKGHQYFSCAKKHGVLVAPSKVLVVDADQIDFVDWDAARGTVTTQRPSYADGQKNTPNEMETTKDGVYGVLQPFVEPATAEVKLNLPLGMSFDAVPGYGAYVTKCKPGSNSAESGKVMPDMRIVKVNGSDTEGKTKRQIAQLFKASENSVALELSTDEEGCGMFRRITATVQKLSLESPLGMSFDGTKDRGFYVTKVKPGGNAELNGSIKVGMRFTSINAESVYGLGKKDVTALIKASVGPCNIELVTDEDAFAQFKDPALGADGYLAPSSQTQENPYENTMPDYAPMDPKPIPGAVTRCTYVIPSYLTVLSHMSYTVQRSTVQYSARQQPPAILD